VIHPSLPLPVIVGPTASGKTLLGHHLALHLKSGVMNADSMQVYKELPCLSAQPEAALRSEVPYFLLGYRGVEDLYSAGHWYRDVTDLLDRLLPQKKQPVFVGGTGMYLKVLMQGIIDCPAAPESLRSLIRDTMEEVSPPLYHRLLSLYHPDLVAKIHPHDRLRLLRAAEVWIMTGQSPKALRGQESPSPYPFFVVALMPDRSELYPRINARFSQMLEGGAVNEVQALLARQLTPHHPAMKMIGVPEIAGFLLGKLSKSEMMTLGMQASRRYAKRQMTWIRHQIRPDIVLPFCVTESTLENALKTVLNTMTHKK
jgi:tRNA dimethylallyltransferase